MLNGLLLVKKVTQFIAVLFAVPTPHVKRRFGTPRSAPVYRTDSSREKAFWSAPQGAVMPLAVPTPHVKKRFGAPRNAPVYRTDPFS